MHKNACTLAHTGERAVEKKRINTADKRRG